MSYKQLRDANWRVKATGGWCLKYVQDAFGTDHPDPDAMNAWNDNYRGGNHTSLPPVGKTVPVYFWLGNVPQGHVAISLDDGKVASSTKAGTQPTGYIHPNLNDLVAVYGKYNGGCRYLGWSEYVGTVRVVQDVNPNATDDQIRQAYLEILERPVDNGGLIHFRNYTNAFMRNDLATSAEYHTLQGNKAAAAQAAKDAAARDIAAKAAAEAIAVQVAEVARLKALEAAKLAAAIEVARLAELKAQADLEAEKAKNSPLDVENNTLLKQILALLTALMTKITNIFKG